MSLIRGKFRRKFLVRLQKVLLKLMGEPSGRVFDQAFFQHNENKGFFRG